MQVEKQHLIVTKNHHNEKFINKFAYMQPVHRTPNPEIPKNLCEEFIDILFYSE